MRVAQRKGRRVEVPVQRHVTTRTNTWCGRRYLPCPESCAFVRDGMYGETGFLRKQFQRGCTSPLVAEMQTREATHILTASSHADLSSHRVG